MTSEHIIHQLLHGYQNGHRLLASSIELPRHIERDIAHLSDLPSASVRLSPAPFISGYPIPELRSFVLAMTWEAPELQRPGCVWTHSLLVPEQFVRVRRSLTQLHSLLRRPSVSEGLASYSQPLDGNVINDIRQQLQPSEWLRGLLREVYGSSAPIVVPSGREGEDEIALLALWSQLPSEVRLNLTFAAGAPGPRKFRGRPFWIQLARPEYMRSFYRSLLPTHDSANAPIGRWLDVVFNDLIRDGAPFSPYVRTFASSATLPEEVRPFAAVFAAVQASAKEGVVTDDNVVIVLAAMFPRADEAISLKAAALEPSAIFEVEAKPEQWHTNVLLGIASLDAGHAFTQTDLRIDARALLLSSLDVPVALKLLSRVWKLQGELAQNVRHALVRAISQDLAGTPSSRVLRPLLIDEPDAVVALADAGACMHSSRAALSSEEIGFLSDVLEAAYRLHGHRQWSSVLHRLGRGAALPALSWLSMHEITTLERITVDDVLRVAADDTGATIEWFKFGSAAPDVMATVIAGIGLGGRDLQQIPAEVLGTTVRWSSASASAPAPLSVLALVMAAALEGNLKAPLEFVLMCFDPLHRSLASGAVVPDNAWWRLAATLPSVGFTEGWDRCLRLRRAVVEAFDRHGWPVDQFGRLTRDERVMDLLVEELKRNKKASRFWQRVRMRLKQRGPLWRADLWLKDDERSGS